MKSLEQLITELARPDEKFILFCGAGISVNSGVPLAIPFLSHILDRLSIAKTDKRKLIFSGNKLAMPFELFFDVFLKNKEDFELLDVFKIGRPNTTHHFIARCYQSGKCDEIYTTNFDTHIETAFKQKRQKLNRYVKEDQFSAAVTDSKTPKLVKLHGSIHDTGSIRTTLSSIARRSLSEERQMIVDHVFSRSENTRIVILGYSCSDYFDIVDRIENIHHSSAEIYFIDHKQNIKTQPDVHIERIAKKKPFKHFKGFRIKVNTDFFIERLWAAMARGYAEDFSRASNWQDIANEWITKQVDDQRKFTIAARLFYNTGQFERSLKYLKKALKEIKRSDKLAYSRSLINIGVMHYHLKDQQKANDYYLEALGLLSGSDFYYETASLLNNLALNLYKQDTANKDKAIGYLEQTLILTRDHDFPQSALCKAGAMCNLGIIAEYENNDDAALKYYLETLAIDTDIEGNKLGEIEVCGYIARIYKRKGQMDLSDQYLNRANHLADPFHKIITTDYDSTKTAK